MARLLLKQCSSEQSIKLQQGEGQWIRTPRMARQYFSPISGIDWWEGKDGVGGHILDVMGFLVLEIRKVSLSW